MSLICRYFNAMIRVSCCFPKNIEYIKQICKPKVLEQEYKKYITEIESNWRTVTHNMKYFVDNMSDIVDCCTCLQGGFNSLIRIKNKKNILQKSFLDSLFCEVKMSAMTTTFFSINNRKDEKDLWIRITVAHPYEAFTEKIDLLKEFVLNNI